MAKTVIGLFSDLSKAQQVIQALVDDGFQREALRTMTSREGVAVGTLTALGVPEPEAQEYAEDVRRGGVLVLVDAADDRADRAAKIMERAATVDLEAQAAPREHERARDVDTGDVKVPVVEEQVHVGTRQVQRGGVRLYTRVTETPVEQEVRLREEHVRVERHPVDRPASEADLAAGRDRTVEVTATGEEPVVAKQERVVEEVVVHKEAEEHTETVQASTRRTEVEVEPVGAGHAQEARGFDAYEAGFRTHATTAGASRGQAYEHWVPAYRYGYDLASDRRYAGRDWAAVEAEARRDWEQHHRGTWEEMKDAIRHAWDTVRGRR